MAIYISRLWISVSASKVRILSAIAVLITTVIVMQFTSPDQTEAVAISGLFDFATWINGGEDWLRENYRWLTKGFSNAINVCLEQVEIFLFAKSWLLVVLLFALPILIFDGLRMTIVVILCIFLWGVFDQWEAAMQTLSLMAVAVSLSCIIGIPIGVACSQNNKIKAVTIPILDAMQTMPAFVYLVPALFFFGIGGTTAVVATMVYAMPPVIRFTNLGLRQVPQASLEVSRSFGATERQLLWRVKFPMALPSVIMGINQTVMMALGLVVLASLIGAPGLGSEIWQALQKLNVGVALEGGISIVSMAIILDRLGAALGNQPEKSRYVTFRLLPRAWGKYAIARSFERTIGAICHVIATGITRVIHIITDVMARLPLFAEGGAGYKVPQFVRRHGYLVCGVVVLIILDVMDGWLFQIGTFPQILQISIAKPVNAITDWLAVNVTFIAFTKGFTWSVFTYLLNPVRQVLMGVPWWYVVGLVSLIAWKSGRLPLAMLTSLGLIFIGILGQWSNAMETLASVLVSVFVCIVIGVPIGIWAAYNKTVNLILRPILDTMQTLPAFVYLVPVIMFFGGNIVSALIATVIYAVPPMVRLSTLGINQIPQEVDEAVRAFGSRTLPALWRVKLPIAIPSITAGINQTIMMAFAMQVITPLIGGRGLGKEVFNALGLADTGRGLVAGTCIVLIAIILDRIILAWSAKQRQALGLQTG